jgi:putative transposase
VVERFFRTLKEQAIYGRIFHNLDEVRAAVAAFVAAYN